MTEDLLPCVDLEPAGSARASIIWLHGLGADGNDFVPSVPELGLEDLGVRFLFPHAPSVPVSINGGFVMPAWYDIRDGDLSQRNDESGLRASASRIEKLVAYERGKGIPADKIIVAGFSQGGAGAAHLALRHDEPLGGLVMLSTYLVCPETLAPERSEANASIPIFMAHGSYDPMVTPERGEAARDLLKELGYDPVWHSYPMQHEVCLEEITELATWLKARLA